MRIVIAGIIGGIVLFLWGAVAHMALPLGEMGHKTPTRQDAVFDALAQSTSGAGVYMYPGIAPEQMRDEAAMAAFRTQNRGKPYAFVVYQPGGSPVIDSMTPHLVKQAIGDVLAALVAAWVLALGAWSFARRVLVAGALGVFSWLTISLPYWNWYLFPLDFTAASLVNQLVDWLLAGAAIAWWLGRAKVAPR